MPLSLCPEFIEQLSEIRESFQQLKKSSIEYSACIKEEYIDMKGTNIKECSNRENDVEHVELGSSQSDMNENDNQSGYMTVEDEARRKE